MHKITRFATIFSPLCVLTSHLPFDSKDEVGGEAGVIEATGVQVKSWKSAWGEERAEDMKAVQSLALH